MKKLTNKAKQEEFLSLLEPIRVKLSRFVRAIAQDREEAKDLASETILVAFTNFEKLKNKQAFLSYLFTIASRLHKQSFKRKKFWGEYDEENALQLVSYNSPPDVNYDVEILYKTLKLLPLKQQEAIILFEISGFSLEEIKEIQGGTLSGVKSRLKRGRETLTELMESGQQNKIPKIYNLVSNSGGLQSPAVSRGTWTIL